MNFQDIEFPKISFVTGTGTDVGKSYITGWLAKEIIQAGKSCITQKLIQTGNTGMSEDIVLHREIMGTEPFQEDLDFITAPIIFSYPASPDLAARIDGKEIDLSLIEKSTEILSSRFDHVLLEGAGGLMAPVKGELLMVDYIKSHNLPAIAVVSGELGSINHALLTLNAIESYGISLFAVVYNPYFDNDKIIADDTYSFLQKWVKNHFPQSLWIKAPSTIERMSIP